MEKKIVKLILSLNKNIQKRLLGFKDFEAGYVVSNLVGRGRKVLNIGCLWGRDYYFLNGLGNNVVNFDLGDQGLPNMAIGDISKKTKFQDKEFDAIFIGEVLEHLFDDVKALSEIRRILKDNGTLVLTVPYYDDESEHHVRIHSPKTIIRLLRSTGFNIKKMISRGGLISVPWVIPGISRLIGLISLRGRIKFLIKCSNIDYNLGRRNFRLFRLSNSYGVYISARKGISKDFVESNRKGFIKNERNEK